MNRTILRHCILVSRDRLTNHPQYGEGFIHFSFLVVHNKIIEIGVNRSADVPIHYGYHCYSKIHSEVDAYRKARGILGQDSFEIVNVRLNKSNEIKFSKPCPNCEYLLRQLGCEKFYFTTSTGKFERI